MKETKEKQPATREEIEARRREALVVAEQCARMLKERFGARRVTPFGSLLDDGSWHAGSDLDLAVEGLSSEALWEAERQLEAISPPWLEVDLVPLERAHPEVRGRILRERPVPEDPHLALKARLEDELVGLERLARGLEVALERAGAEPDEFATRALASFLDDFYKGCERICERVAVTLDSGPSASLPGPSARTGRTGLPQGEGWHRALLGQMGEPGGEGRPALFGGSLLLELDEYRRFRHRVRHIYGYELETERVLTLARGVKPVRARVRQALEVFGEWLEQQAAT